MKNNNDNNSNKSGELFIKIFRNIYLRQVIFKYIRFLNQSIYPRYYKSYDKFYKSKVKEQINSVILKLDSESEFLNFMYNIPPNITNIKFYGSSFTIQFNDLYIPESIKYINLLRIDLIQKSNLTHTEQHQKQTKDTVVNKISSIFKKFNNKNNNNNNNNNNNINNNRFFTLNNNHSIISLELSNSSWELIANNKYYPPSLTNLTIINPREIKDGEIPNNLYSLKLRPCYKYQYISLPIQLKKLFIGDGFISAIQSSCMDSFPSSLTSLKLLSPNNDRIKPFKKELSESLRKLVLTYDYKEPLYITQDAFKSLTHLDISRIYRYSDLRLNLLPSTLKTLKLPNSPYINSDNFQVGFPSSLTNLKGTTLHLTLNFQNPSALEYIHLNSNSNNHFINFDNFPNIKSIFYDNVISPECIYISSPPPSKLLNLEIACSKHLKFNETPDVIYNKNLLKPIESLECLNLDYGYTKFLLINNLSSPFPSKLKLLQLEFNSENDRYSSKSITISKDTIPNDLEILIIRGNYEAPNIILPLPNSIQNIFISSEIKPKLNNGLLNQSNHKINFVNSQVLDNPKFYNKFKRYYLNK